MILDPLLGSDTVLALDGATGSEVSRLGAPMHGAAWCALANKTHPAVVRDVHAEYIRAGANIVTTNSFATCRHVLAGAGLADEAVSITKRSVQLALEARELAREAGARQPVAVAGSMSNNLAWIPGTTSFDPGLKPSSAEESANYREMADALAESGVDFLILEMMMDVDRSSHLAEAAVATGLPVWIGISASLHANGSVTAWDIHAEEERLDASHAREVPQALGEVISTLAAFNPQVMGIMHSTAAATTPALATLFDLWDGPVMAYPEATDHASLGPAGFAHHCRGWVEQGVQIVGGCCGTTINHIAAMVEALPARVGKRQKRQRVLGTSGSAAME